MASFYVSQPTIFKTQMLTSTAIAKARRLPSRSPVRRVTASLQQCLEQERTSIARDVHDEIGGALTAIHLDLAWIGRHCEDAAVLRRVQDAHQMLQQAFDAARRICADLRPPTLDWGLVSAIEGLASGFQRRTGVRTAVVLSNGPLDDVSEAVQLVVYRTVQEALTNVSRHARGCTEVSIALGRGPQDLRVAIEDNGNVASPANIDKPGSFGLKGLRARAHSVQGTLAVRSGDGAGTCLTLSVPDAHPLAAAGEGVDR